MQDDSKDPVTLSVTLEPHVVAALDAWIARSKEPTLTRDAAVGHVLAAALGHDSPSTIIPGLFTGRDIV